MLRSLLTWLSAASAFNPNATRNPLRPPDVHFIQHSSTLFICVGPWQMRLDLAPGTAVRSVQSQPTLTLDESLEEPVVRALGESFDQFVTNLAEAA